MKVYLASQFDNKILLQSFKELLKIKYPEVEVTSTWIKTPVLSLQDAARMDFSDIENSDLVIAFYPGHYGTSSELGYALAKHIPIIFVSPHYIHLYEPELNNLGMLPVGKLIQYEKSPYRLKDMYKIYELNGIIVYSLEQCLDTLLLYLKNYDETIKEIE